MKKSFMVFMVMVFLLWCSGISLAAYDMFLGTITKIDGKNITIKAENGDEKIVKGSARGLAVGDKVTVKNGKIVKGVEVKERKGDNDPPPEPPKGKLKAKDR